MPVTVRRDDDGFDFAGPYVRGVRDDRHLGLIWGDLRADEPHVLIERHPLREPLRVHHFSGSLCSPKTSFNVEAISPSVAYARPESTACVASGCVS